MVIRCSVSLVDLKIWTFEAFRLIVTSPQVSTFSATAESDFGRSVLFIILQPVSMIYIFPFPYIVLKIPDTIRNLGYPCIINVWLLTSGSGICHVLINWHFLTESKVSCVELWRNKYLIENLYSFIFTKMAFQRFELLTQLKSALRLFSKWIKVP